MIHDTPRASGGTVDVLHVDDDPAFAETTSLLLEREADDVAVETATGAEEGLERLAEGAVDCVVSDYDMPGRNGIEFLEAVREDHPDLPFILFTGKGSEEIARKAIRAGVTDYVQKRGRESDYTVLANRIGNAVAQHERKRQQQRFQAFVERSTDVVTVLDVDGSCLYQSPPAERVLGYPVEELLGAPVFEYVHPEDRDRVVEAFETVVADPERSLTVEYRFRHGDGDWIWLESIGNNQLDNPAVEGVVINSREVTERKRREQELRHSAELIEALSKTFPDYAFIYDRTGEYLEVITGWRTGTTAYTAEELVGQRVDEVMAPATADSVRTAIEGALDADELRTVEYAVDGADGTTWYEATAAPLPDGYEGRPAVVMAARDVTGRKRRERELRRQNERLEEFAGVVSHDLRSPLSVAQTRLELARREHDADPDHLADVAAAHDRMEALIDDLLALARQGRAVDEREPVALAPLVEACARTATAEATTVRTTAEPTVLADRSRLRELLENLLGNAVEHAGEGVTVTVGATEEGFYVADDGPGIDPEQREAVFEPGHSTTESGTGFGLSIVRRIAEAHGWTVEATGSEHGGARIELRDVETVGSDSG
jgi:PAS domain S-box-containing protein